MVAHGVEDGCSVPNPACRGHHEKKPIEAGEYADERQDGIVIELGDISEKESRGKHYAEVEEARHHFSKIGVVFALLTNGLQKLATRECKHDSHAAQSKAEQAGDDV